TTISTLLPVKTQATVSYGIICYVLILDVVYLTEFRTYPVPFFAISSDHEEILRIQGRQFGALLPKGGTVLYIQGPSESSAARQRTAGMYETKRVDIQVKTLKANWTEASAFKAINSWLRLSTSRESRIDVIAAQDDSMVVGARKAFQEQGSDRERGLGLPFTGCDGLPKTGQAWVRSGLLAATIFV